jgi:uncharacterized OsmC-like protein
MTDVITAASFQHVYVAARTNGYHTQNIEIDATKRQTQCIEKLVTKIALRVKKLCGFLGGMPLG